MKMDQEQTIHALRRDLERMGWTRAIAAIDALWADRRTLLATCETVYSQLGGIDDTAEPRALLAGAIILAKAEGKSNDQ